MSRSLRHGATLAAVTLLLAVAALPAGASPPSHVMATLRLGQSVHPPGTSIPARGLGFGPGERIDLFFDDSVVVHDRASLDGSFFLPRLRIPADATPGMHTVAAVGQDSGMRAEAQLAIRTNWAQFGKDASGTRSNARENVIDPSNVSTLVEGWTAIADPSDGWLQDAAVVFGARRGILLVGDSYGDLYAFDANGCSEPPCSRLWRAGGEHPGDRAPAIANEIAFVTDAGYRTDGWLSAYRAWGCGNVTCEALWSSENLDFKSAATFANGTVYIGSAGGGLYAYGARGCGANICDPRWKGLTAGAVGNSTAAASGGVVYVGAEDGQLYAFDASGCGDPTCEPSWVGQTAPGELLDSSPAVVNGVVYVVSRDGLLFAFDATGCGASVCAPIWQSEALSASSFGPKDIVFSSPAVADGLVFVSSGDDVLRAFSAAGCGEPTCSPVWSGPPGSASALSSLSVANGVVYAVGVDGALRAFADAGCGGPPVCDPLWTGPGDTQAAGSSPVIADGRVFLPGDHMILYEFQLPG